MIRKARRRHRAGHPQGMDGREGKPMAECGRGAKSIQMAKSSLNGKKNQRVMGIIQNVNNNNNNKISIKIPCKYFNEQRQWAMAWKCCFRTVT